MLIGYARVSTTDQDAAAQVRALEASGCETIFTEKASGGRWDRPELQRLLGHLRKGDVVVVWKLDRLSRSLKDVLTLMESIDTSQAGFRSLTEPVDTTTPAGRMMMQMVGAFAEFERAILKERTQAGLKVARSRTHRRPQASAQARAATGGYQTRHQRDEERGRRCSAVQRASSHGIPAAARRGRCCPPRQRRGGRPMMNAFSALLEARAWPLPPLPPGRRPGRLSAWMVVTTYGRTDTPGRRLGYVVGDKAVAQSLIRPTLLPGPPPRGE